MDRKRLHWSHDGQLLESVLMAYEDGCGPPASPRRRVCAMGCVFCATGQMGFARHLTPAEIFEQAARFSAELRAEATGSRTSC